MRSSFGGRVWREQVSAPLDLNVIFLLELIDPNLADVAEGSNVVREDDHRDRFTRSDFQCCFPSCCRPAIRIEASGYLSN